MKNISRARTANGRLIQPHEIQRVMGFDKGGAIRDHKHVRKSLGTGSDDLLVSQYCKFYGLDYFEVIEFLSARRN